MGKWCEMATVDVKYDTTPHDGTPGPPWDDFEERILGVAAGRTDDRGWSLADCANQTDEGLVALHVELPALTRTDGRAM